MTTLSSLILRDTLMKLTKGSIVITIICLLAQPLCAQTDPETNIENWIRKLDDDKFIVREHATERLIETGLPAINPVYSATRSSSLEVLIRIIKILKTIAISDDLAASDSATEALSSLAKGTGNVVSRRAARAFLEVAEVRGQRALAELQKLGARFFTAPIQGAILQHTPSGYGNALEIGTDWRGTEQDLKHLAMLTDITHIQLTGKLATDSWLQPLALMPSLQSIVVKTTQISDAGMTLLTKLKHLESLEISYTPITDHSIESFSKLERIRNLKLYGTRISTVGVTQLSVKRPNLNIDFRRGGFLGVGGVPHDQGFLITTVLENSSAMKAGLQIGDILRSCNEQPLKDFDDLRRMIGENAVEEKIVLVFLRDSKEQKTDVILGSMADSP